MEDKLSDSEKQLAELVVEFHALVKNTDKIPEILSLLTLATERTEVNRKDINLVGKRVSVVEHDVPILIQEANDRANITSRFILGISVIFSTGLFAYFALDLSDMKSTMSEMSRNVAIHNTKLTKIDERYKFLEMEDD